MKDELNTIANLLGLTPDDLLTLIVLAIGGLIVLGLLRFMFRLTANLLKLGCAVLLILLALVFIASLWAQ